MELFLDTANIDEIRRAAAMGVISGVTTNPSLLAREGVQYRDRVLEICEVVHGPISAECVSTTADEIVAEGKRIAAWHPNVVVKVALDEQGLQAIKRLAAEGIRVNTTLIFSANQALLAARAGAAFVSPFIGRLDDIGEDGMQVVRDCIDIFDRHGLDTQVIAASVRHTRHVTEAALAGSHIATVPSNVLLQMLKHPLTDLGMAAFLRDSAKYQPV
ncbi:MAG: fructose-6-phosphate aldolase [Dehalococcoidia bacterium]